MEKSLPEVGGVMRHREHQWVIISELASGPFSKVFQVRDLDTRVHYAMKVEPSDNVIRPVLKLDVFILSQLGNGVGFPRLCAAVREDHYKYVVMQLVGPDLGKLRRAMPQQKFTLATALRVCRQTLDRIKTLHEFGWLSRDIKAPNFAIGLAADSGIVYMLDFGLARRYRAPDGSLFPPRTTTALLGTIHYAPLASHHNQEQCRRDDLESWFYMCAEMMSGRLLWANLHPMKDHKIIADWKSYCRGAGRENFLHYMPEEFDGILSLIDSLKYEDMPDYQLITDEIERAMDRAEIDRNAPLDWQVNNGYILEKAKMVGELGESHLASERLRDAHLTDPPSTTAQLISSESHSGESEEADAISKSSVGRNSHLATAISATISNEAVTTAISGVDLTELVPLMTAISKSTIFDDTQATSASSNTSVGKELQLRTARSPDIETAVEV